MDGEGILVDIEIINTNFKYLANGTRNTDRGEMYEIYIIKLDKLH